YLPSCFLSILYFFISTHFPAAAFLQEDFSVLSSSFPFLYPPVEYDRHDQRKAVYDGLHPHASKQPPETVHKKQQGNIQNAFAEYGTHQGFLELSHGLELDDHRITYRHHRHCRYHL